MIKALLLFPRGVLGHTSVVVFRPPSQSWREGTLVGCLYFLLIKLIVKLSCRILTGIGFCLTNI